MQSEFSRGLINICKDYASDLCALVGLSSEDGIPEDFIYGCPIFLWVEAIRLHKLVQYL